MIAERVEFLVDSIFSVDDQGLMLGDVVRLAEVFKDRGIGGLKTVGQWLASNVLIMAILAGEKVQGSLAVTRVDALFGLDLNVTEERAAFLVKLVIDEGTIRILRRDNRLQPPNSAAEANEDHIGTLVIFADYI